MDKPVTTISAFRILNRICVNFISIEQLVMVMMNASATDETMITMTVIILQSQSQIMLNGFLGVGLWEKTNYLKECNK